MSKTYEVRIEGKGKNKELWLGENKVCPLNDFLILKYKLHNGEVVIADWNEMLNDCAYTIGFEKAVDYLAKGMKTTKQVRDYLGDKVYNSVLDSIIDKLSSYGYLDDTQYARAFVEQNSQKSGKNKLKMQLIQKGISASIINDVLSEVSGIEVAVGYAKKYMKNKEPTKENLAKLSRHLYSKGFTYEEIRKAISIFKGGDYESWD